MDEPFSALCDELLALIGRLLARALPKPFALAKGLLARAERREIVAWLAPLENLVRSLIMFRTLELPPGRPGPERVKGLPIPAFTIGLPREGIAIPGFRIMPPEEAGAWGGMFPREGAVRAMPAHSFPAWPLAQRLENALDALDHPEPHMRRLAKRLWRDPGSLPKPERPAQPRVMGGLAEACFLAECRDIVAQAAAADTS